MTKSRIFCIEIRKNMEKRFIYNHDLLHYSHIYWTNVIYLYWDELLIQWINHCFKQLRFLGFCRLISVLLQLSRNYILLLLNNHMRYVSSYCFSRFIGLLVLHTILCVCSLNFHKGIAHMPHSCFFFSEHSTICNIW